jgi:hypothetical protein
VPFPNPTGGVFLDNVRFPTNPDVYEPLNWKKRETVFPSIGGKVTIQDFGVYMKDDTIRLASGQGQFLDEATVIALHTRWRTRGATYTLTDWLRNNFTVFIREFVPVNYRPDLYRYTMALQVTQIVQLWGTVFTGA